MLKNAHWNNVSEEAKDLVYKMITYKNERLTLKQLIEHPWLQNIEDLKKYNKINKKNRYIGWSVNWFISYCNIYLIFQKY